MNLKSFIKCLFFLVTFSIELQSCRTIQSKSSLKVKDCLDHLKYNSDYWKRDSLGQNGFRQLYATTVLNKCNFQGLRWTNLSSLLGQANSVYNNSMHTTYIYRLEYDGKELYPGMLILDIQIRNDTVLVFKVRPFHD